MLQRGDGAELAAVVGDGVLDPRRQVDARTDALHVVGAQDRQRRRLTTPMMKLVGFSKLDLQPGATQRISFTMPSRELALWNPQMKRVVEPGTITVMVGSSAETITLRSTFRVTAPRASRGP